MTEAEARQWIEQRFGSERTAILATYADRLCATNQQQNLVSAATLGSIWVRHLLDSAQLVPLAPAEAPGTWLDIGSGAGLPGLVVATLSDRTVLLVEPRRLRAAFLSETAAMLVLPNVTVLQQRIERVSCPPAAVISARAVASLGTLLAIAQHCASRETVWLLPRGRHAHQEVAEAKRAWHGVFHVEQSLTSSDSAVVIARGVSPR